MRSAWLNHDVYRLWRRQMIRQRVGTVLASVSLSSAEGPAFTQAYSALQHRLSLTALACQLTTTMPPGYHRELCRLPTEYPNSLTLRGLPQHKLNIKLGAPVMLRPRVWPLQRHRLHRPVIRGADTSQHALHAANIQTMSYYFPAFHCHRQTPASCTTWQLLLSHKHQLVEQQIQRQTTTCSPRTRDHHLDTGRVEPRGPSSSSLEPSTVTAQVCRSHGNA